MSLSELEDKERIFFLLDFVGELVINSAQDENLRNLIKSEKLKKKYLETEDNSRMKHIGKTRAFQDKEYFKKSELKQSVFSKVSGEDRILKPIKSSSRLNYKRSNMQLNKEVIKDFNPKLGSGRSNEMTFPLKKNIGASTEGVNNFNSLKKIDGLIKDKNIQMIECPGPGKNVLVKTRNKINLTKIILSEDDIKGIANYFSEEARIPMMSGILKAAVGDLIISAVISQYIGSRFIIIKRSPYSIIEGVNTFQ